jgi:allophanate hydrolase subunit 2
MSNRVGARLAGASLTRARAGELPSEGIVLGAVQVPADGEPLVFLADHPATGGYPVVAVVEAADLPALAQARPGTTVRFHGPQR